MSCERWSNEAATVHADITADHRDVPAYSFFFCDGPGLSQEPLHEFLNIPRIWQRQQRAKPRTLPYSSSSCSRISVRSRFPNLSRSCTVSTICLLKILVVIFFIGMNSSCLIARYGIQFPADHFDDPVLF